MTKKNNSKTLVHFPQNNTKNQPQNNLGQSSSTDPAATFGSVLQKYRLKNDMSQPDLAAMLGVSRNTVTNWEINKSRPDISMIRQLVTMFGIPLYELFDLPSEDLPSIKESHLLSSYRKLSAVSQKVIERMILSMYEEETNARYDMLRETYCILPLAATPVAAGIGCEEVPLPPEAFFIKQSKLAKQADTIIRVSGKSMEPKYHDGDLVYVQFIQEAADGEDVVCYYNEGAVIKRHHNNKLYSLNSKYPFGDKTDEDNVRMVGRVLGIVDDEDIPDAEDTALLQDVMNRELREFEAEHGIE